jgi:deoxyribonuclease IV
VPDREAAISRPIGAHASVVGGLADGALGYARDVGAEAIQIFVTNPRGWSTARVGEDQAGAQCDALRGHVRSTGLPVFVHAPYLINLGSPDEVLRARSADLLGNCLERGQRAGARGVVVHTGSSITSDRQAGLDRMREALLPVLDKIPADGPDVLLEPMAGQGQMLCATIADIGPYLAALDNHPRAQLCLDTCHVFAAGHDLAAIDGADAMIAELAAIAPGRLRLIHANDSADPCGSRRDHHRPIGDGQIGAAAFGRLLAHLGTAGVAFVVETPGGKEGQARDIAVLRALRDGHDPAT